MANQEQWLKVNTPYSGIDTNGLVVQAGEYPVGAPELYGASDGLVEHGAAEWIDAPEVVEEAVEAEPAVVGDATPEALELLDKAVLKEMLDAQGIDHSHAKNKAALLALFDKAE